MNPEERQIFYDLIGRVKKLEDYLVSLQTENKMRDEKIKKLEDESANAKMENARVKLFFKEFTAGSPSTSGYIRVQIDGLDYKLMTA